MKASEIKKGIRVWCWWKSRALYYTGREDYEKGYNIKTKDYTPRHYYAFEDICGAATRIYDEDVEKLELR